MTSVNMRDEYDDEQLRALLAEGAPDFPAAPFLGDRALAGAARRRTRARATLGGAGAVAVLAVGALAVAPLAGWGGHGSGDADAVAPGTSAASTTAPVPAPSPPVGSPTTSRPVPPPISLPTTVGKAPAWANSPKQKAAERVMAALQSGGHDKSFMGVGLSGVDYADGTFNAASAYDASPIIVYRKPIGDATLERDAINAAAPFSVVFRDTVLDASEQWFLGHRIHEDTNYWTKQGVVFGTALQENGTITIYAEDPGKVVPLFEQHYGYDGRVFVGHKMVHGEAVTPPSTVGGS